MYFLLGFFVMLSVFMSLQASQQERDTQRRQEAIARANEAASVYTNRLTSYESAYRQFDTLIEKNDILPFPRDFEGQWKPVNSNRFNQRLIEFSEDGTLHEYHWPNGATCFSPYRGGSVLTRYAEDHYILGDNRYGDRLTIEGNDENITISVVYLNGPATPKHYTRIDYREQDEYKICATDKHLYRLPR